VCRLLSSLLHLCVCCLYPAYPRAIAVILNIIYIIQSTIYLAEKEGKNKLP
jgi:hypothetical protein